MKGEEGKGREERKGKRRWATGDKWLERDIQINP